MKKDFKKFAQKNVHKRRAKEESTRALLRALREVNENYTADVKLKAALDRGRGGRETHRAGRDEIVARGVFSSSKSGFGFVKVDGVERDIFIPEDKCNCALDGDLVEIIYHEYFSMGNQKTEGRVKKIIKYGRESLIGVVARATVSRRDRFRANRYQLIPDDPRILIRPFILDMHGFKEGDKIEARIDRSVPRGFTPECSLVRNFGDAESREANYGATLALCGIETEFSDEVLAEALSAASAPLSHEGRTVVKGECVFTMDGADAKDLDDAVSIRRKSDGGWRLGVHIADVSSYVGEKSALERAAMSRGTSVYFADKVVPMLPPVLSNGVCSLNAGEEKRTLSAFIDIDREGNIIGVKILPTVINSAVRGVYSEVNSLLSGSADKQIKEKYKKALPSLLKMKELYHILESNSQRRGAIDFDADEARIVLDDKGEPVDVVKRERGLAEKMIEQFMIAANVAVAEELDRRGIPCVYRVHAEPPKDKLSDFINFAHNLGLNTAAVSKESPTAADFTKLLREADSRGLIAPVSYAMLRAMSKAEYSKTRAGHFGLGLSHYCHFTSPIRRLSDLATHRIINKVIFDGKRAEAYASFASRAAAAATEAEIRAQGAERKIENLFKTAYMAGFIGETFEATVSSVASFGLFCMLENTCEGLVPISELPGMFFFDEKNISMRSKDRIYRLGDRVLVRVEEADITSARVRFSICEEE